MKVEYSSNNSGGHWWLKDEHWYALAAAGWDVKWAHSSEYADADGRSLGALATEATKEVETPGEAMREFERITGQDVTDEGCYCCGAPHSFSWGEGKDWSHACGQSCDRYLRR